MNRIMTLVTKALLDTGASGLFIDSEFVHRNHIPLIKLLKPQGVYNVDGMENEAGKITHVVDLVV